MFENFNKSFYHDGYEDAYYLGYSDAKKYNNLEPITDDEEDTIFDLVYTIAIENWGADYELVEDPDFINEVVRGYNDGIMDYREKDSNREYSRMDNEIYRRHHGRGINENIEENILSRKEVLENVFDVLSNNTNYITSADFASMFPNMEIDYEDGVIILQNGMYLKLVDRF